MVLVMLLAAIMMRLQCLSFDQPHLREQLMPLARYVVRDSETQRRRVVPFEVYSQAHPRSALKFGEMEICAQALPRGYPCFES